MATAITHRHRDEEPRRRPAAPGDGRRPRRSGPSGPRRTAARLLAPLALVAVAIAVALLASSNTGGTKARPTAAPLTAPRSNRHFWIVRRGQTLSLIVRRTGVSVADIERLNPGLNPGLLILGQHIRVRP